MVSCILAFLVRGLLSSERVQRHSWAAFCDEFLFCVCDMRLAGLPGAKRAGLEATYLYSNICIMIIPIREGGFHMGRVGGRPRPAN